MVLYSIRQFHDNDLGLAEVGELLDVEQLVPEPTVEGLDEGVSHGEPGSCRCCGYPTAGTTREALRGSSRDRCPSLDTPVRLAWPSVLR
jgi:hypothetical protein